MIVLDTNVLSGLMLPSREPVVVEWLNRQIPGAVWTTAVTVFEIRTGIDRLPEGRRRQARAAAFELVLAEELRGRVVSFDQVAAGTAGRLRATRIRQGFTDDVRDIQIAGIVLARRATLATRNVRHFRGLGAMVVNPWEPD
jgi:predicted nucleic acid-binding protein